MLTLLALPLAANKIETSSGLRPLAQELVPLGSSLQLLSDNQLQLSFRFVAPNRTALGIWRSTFITLGADRPIRLQDTSNLEVSDSGTRHSPEGRSPPSESKKDGLSSR